MFLCLTEKFSLIQKGTKEGRNLKNVCIRAVRKRNWDGGEIETDRIERRNDENLKGKPNREVKEERCSWIWKKRYWKKK